ncbi:MAG: DeoR/GlpR family DNA-binding transcription regulator [Bacteroidota bacterium]
MLKRERQALILEQINRHNKVLSADLSTKLSVSEDTIRRDLNELAEQGEVVKVYGGALSTAYHPSSYPKKQVYAYEAKTVIAKKAVSLLKDGMFILISGGTTCREFARNLPHDLNATIFTISLSTAMQLMEHPSLEVIFLGGKLSKNTQLSVTGKVLQQLQNVRMDICFTGLNGLDPEKGMTDNDWEVVQVTQAMMQASDRVVALTISEKLHSVQRMKVCDLSRINTLVTELSPENPAMQPFKKEGLALL